MDVVVAGSLAREHDVAPQALLTLALLNEPSQSRFFFLHHIASPIVSCRVSVHVKNGLQPVEAKPENNLDQLPTAERRVPLLPTGKQSRKKTRGGKRKD
jgi:hypothetical protein